MGQLVMPRVSVGEILDGAYLMGEIIGRGGMAVVHEGRTIEGDDPVAIKLMALELDNDRSEVQRRFFNELLLAARVKHPNIVQIHDFGVTSSGGPGGAGISYIVMERLRGLTITQELRRAGPMEPERAAMRLLEVLDGVGEAHACGVVHADLKPSNLFLADPNTTTEKSIILDFGVARRLEGPLVTSAWGGTPRYCPPEVLMGEEITPPVDLFQLALVLSEMLSGKPLVAGHNIEECLVQHASGLTLPDAVRTSVFGHLIARATRADPTLRFQTVSEFREALGSSLDTMRRSQDGEGWAPDPQDRTVFMTPGEQLALLTNDASSIPALHTRNPHTQELRTRSHPSQAPRARSHPSQVPVARSYPSRAPLARSHPSLTPPPHRPGTTTPSSAWTSPPPPQSSSPWTLGSSWQHQPPSQATQSSSTMMITLLSLIFGGLLALVFVGGMLVALLLVL